MQITKTTVSVTLTASTDSDNSTGYVNGNILAVEYIKSTGTSISATAGLTITSLDSSISILGSLLVGSASFIKAPRLSLVDTTNGAITDGHGYIPVPDERIKVKVSKSTSTGQTGTFNIYSM